MSKSAILRLLDNPMREETSEWPRCARGAVVTRKLSGLMVASMPGLYLFDFHLTYHKPLFREWVSPAAVTWMLKEVVENDSAHSDLTETLDW